MKVFLLLSLTLCNIWRVSTHDYNICARGEIAYHQVCGGFAFFHLSPCGIGQICRLYPGSYYGRCCKRIIIAPKLPPRVDGCPSGSIPVEASCGGFIGSSCPWGTFCVKQSKPSNGVCCKWF
ncbi:hypothetical protein CHS0354_034500 [Potamilus streckersoni]|uniref:Uncharacterized protein n=1 Tax=Potamilus streckersoni TaxID=2493646 RepID=A0AAE0SQC3_9BIVA|nr:hypothetical protein CHS0354_034500 [Potamilus streckersoni]